MTDAEADNVPWMIAATIDCHDLESTARFWSELFNMEIAGIEEPFAFLSPAGDRKVSIWLQKVPETKAGKNRVHLDFAVHDLEATERKVVELGGSLGDKASWHDFSWRTCLDPEGNEFDVMQAQKK